MFIEISTHKRTSFMEIPKRHIFLLTDSELKIASTKLAIGIQKPEVKGKRYNTSYSAHMLATAIIPSSVHIHGKYYRVYQNEEGKFYLDSVGA